MPVRVRISAHPNLVSQLFHTLIPTTFTFCIKKGNSHCSCLKQSVRKIVCYWLKKVIIEKLKQKFLPVQKGGFPETACPKDRLDRSWLSPCYLKPLHITFF